ncbi:hypothetical protein D4764_0103490 [Takifugu flavidus]|uniref:DUF5641 domain-containing protein n=1 Tax=Takifugu flavidus TaxID=433684 RepID=A0A5C6MI21_9TELE|nr:hypothetical protein D4764_0103490 [Takifugu flavidus]
MLKQKADYDASLHLLQCQKAAAAAEAEAIAYEEVESGELSQIGDEPMDTAKRTSDYVHQQSQLLFSEQPAERETGELLEKKTSRMVISDTRPASPDAKNTTQPAYKEVKGEPTAQAEAHETTPHPYPSRTSFPERGYVPEPQGAQDLARYLIRKEMVSSGLLKFDDKPENYWSWKASFISATKDLDLIAREELDLMTKWLGPGSSEQAKRIRAVHVFNPGAGVNMVWQRLEECYGTPEVIEDALLRKIEQFPKLHNRDTVRLRELGDILLELECAKEDGALPGLLYLDTARGIKQIVEKLPYNLQEKWTGFGSKYKEDHRVAFPPFFVFSNFVRQQAKMKNDPSFTISTTNSSPPLKTDKLERHYSKPFVKVHKTDVPAEPPDTRGNLFINKPEEPDRQCPIHKKPHPLRKCKLFREKPLEERKVYLRENRICFRCCGSVQHMARDCKIDVKCFECGSDKHISALHPGPPPSRLQNHAAGNDAEEQTGGSSPSVTSKCTEVCGNVEGSRSCAKILLVKVYPAGEKEKAVKMYAVLDEQSNKSLAKSDFFDLFNIQTNSTPYTLRTCSGKIDTSGRRGTNFILESVNGKLHLPLPPLIECDMVPDDRAEIPSPEIALHHPHLKPVADKIQPVDYDAPILLLIGRDMGPDLNNSLLGVLMRFRKNPVALTADVQQMFYCFIVQEEHRDYLRYLWYEDNDVNKKVVEFRMKVHVFGNSPSPAVAIYCMRRAAETGEEEHGSDARQFVERQFYVDDGLTSVPTCKEAVNLLTRTKEMLAESNLRLHKVASNKKEVMEAFSPEDLAKDLKDLELGVDPLPLQRSLGLSWNLEADCFTYLVSQEEKPFTRRGVLSTVNSLYDPLGFVAPITMQGKALVRELSSDQTEWDAPLSPKKESEWNLWKDSLKALEDLQIPRCYISTSLSSNQRKELCIFSDASTKAIGAVAYLRITDTEGQHNVGFVMGKSKLAPRPAHTIPRLELCAAVLAVELYELIRDEIDVEVDVVKFFTDSKIVLGYICNSTRRFYMYVSNRVIRIRRSTHPDQWHYVPTELNPADVATRTIPSTQLQRRIWFSGPAFLYHDKTRETMESSSFSLVEPEADEEIRPEVKTFVTKTSNGQLGSHRFERCSSWTGLNKTIARLIHIGTSYRRSVNAGKKGWRCFKEKVSLHELSQSKTVIIRSVQQEALKEELKCLGKGHKMPGRSTLERLNPIIDEEGLLRIGGRLSSADLSKDEKHPLIMPHNHHVSTLLVRHFHEQVAHQGRHITEGALRAAGYWMMGSKRLVSSIIYKCVTCRKLRGRLEEQKMADLPPDRLSPEPPFTTVGLDIFGPWAVSTRRTRGGSADSKRWAVLFTCMATRAVHIELIEAMRILDAILLQKGPIRLTHEILSTFMAEVMAIINARPLVPISTDPEMPAVLTPAMLLTQKMSTVSAPSGDFCSASLYRKQWKQVQCLADTFWKRWKGEYLSTLQCSRKWTNVKPNVKEGDVVLLKDSQAHRNEWPVGLIVKALPSSDRKVEVRVVKEGKAKVFLRPITEIVVLLSEI